VSLAAGGSLAALTELHNGRVVQKRTAALEALDLNDIEAGRGFASAAIGEGMRLTLRTHPRTVLARPLLEGTAKTWLELEVDNLPQNLRLSPRGPGRVRATRRRLLPPFVTGDPSFDLLWRVEPRPRDEHPGLVAALSHDARTLLAEQLQKNWVTVQGGVIRAALPRLVGRPQALAEAVEGLVELGKALALGDSTIPDRLLAHGRNDPVAGFRRHAMRLLLKRFKSYDQARDIAPLAVVDADPWVATLGAMALGEQGYDQVGAYARDTRQEPWRRGMAIEHLARQAPDDFVIPLFNRLFHDRQPEVLAAVTRGLGRFGDAWIEPAVIRLLTQRQDIVRMAAVETLAARGTAASVEPLRRELKRLRNDAKTKDTIARALERVRTRLSEEAVGGALALSETEQTEAPVDAGMLALAEEHSTAGSLALAQDQTLAGALGFASDSGDSGGLSLLVRAPTEGGLAPTS